MNRKKLARDELIGLNIKIKECTDPTWLGKEGHVIDETKNTFLIKIDNDNKRIAKKTAFFEFTYNDEKIIIPGSQIMYRPEERIKKIR